MTASSKIPEQRPCLGGSSSMDLAELQLSEFCASPPERQKPVLLLADTMGTCIPVTDSVIRVVMQDNWTLSQVQSDVALNKINVGHKHIIVWVGSTMVKNNVEDQVFQELQDLMESIKLRSRAAVVYISSILPQPKHQRSLQEFIIGYNRSVKKAILQLQLQDMDIHWLPTHTVYLDHNKDIIRPIVENFEDGMHLNLHGAHRLRQFWLQRLGISK